MNNAEVRDGSTLTIGVTGHRRLSDVERLERGVDTALEHIKEVFPRTSWRIISSLAEGADRLVVHRAIRSGIRRLVVSLPLPREEYLKDFDSQASRKEFQQLLDTAEQVSEPSPTQTRADAYAAAGALVLDHSDALVAIWDGKEAQGQGGTADIVAKARLKGLPIAWVHAGNRAPLTDRPNSLGSEQGVVTFENFESPAASVTGRVTGETGPDNPLDKLEDAHRRRDASAMSLQKRRHSFAKFTSSLGPVAVLLLAVQVLVFPERSMFSVGLIALEVGLLGVALAVGFLQIGLSHDLWIRERLRGEVLRRERFLFDVQVGPYLNIRPSELSERVEERLVAIDNDVIDPISHLSLGDTAADWRRALEDSRHQASAAAVPNFKQCLRAYSVERIRGQRQWFSSKSAEHGKRARYYECWAKIVLILAVIASALHLGLLVEASKPMGGWLHIVLMLVAIVAPAVGSAFIAFQSIAGSHRLSRSYRLRAQALEHFERLFARLLLAIEEPGQAEEELRFQFKRGVLEAEQLFSDELREWWLVMHTEAPRTL